MRTSGGAAMNSTISDCTTSTMSTGMPCDACIVKLPGLERAEQDACGEDPPRPAASEKRDGDRIEADAGVDVAVEARGDRTLIWFMPARPAVHRRRAWRRCTCAAPRCPPPRAACGFSPTARRRKPRLERSMSHHTKTVAPITRMNPQSRSGKRGPNSSGNCALAGVGAEIGWSPAGRCSRPGVRTIHVTR